MPSHLEFGTGNGEGIFLHLTCIRIRDNRCIKERKLMQLFNRLIFISQYSFQLFELYKSLNNMEMHNLEGNNKLLLFREKLCGT